MFRIIHAMYSYKSFVIGVNILVSQSTCILLSARSIIVADLGRSDQRQKVGKLFQASSKATFVFVSLGEVIGASLKSETTAA